MVHGGGSCSGRSGGFSSSSHTYIHISTPNNHRLDRHGKKLSCDDCKEWFLCIGLCFGCRGKNHAHRIFKIWAWIFILSFVTGLAVGFGSFGPTNIPASPSDMIPITRGIHPAFCEGVDIETTLPVSTFHLPSPLVVSSKKVKHSINQTALIGADRYEYWGFYLLSGSVIELSICGDNVGDMYIIRGDNNFGSWREDNYDPSTYKKTTRTKPCVQPHPFRTKLQYRVTVRDEYYFVITNHNYRPLSASITFTLNRAVYDLGHHVEVCNNSKQCHVDLSEDNKDKSIVVYVPESDEFDFNIKTTCLRRTEVFIYIFLVVPVIIGILATGLIVCIKCRANAMSRAIYKHERRVLTSSTLGYQAIQNDSRNEPSAPMLSDIMMDPPSYDEAVKSQDR